MPESAAIQKIKALGGEGVLTEQDVAELREATQAVLVLMADGQWHSAIDIRLAAGMGRREASEGLRRLRELRKFFEVAKRRPAAGQREYEYRIEFRKQQ